MWLSWRGCKPSCWMPPRVRAQAALHAQCALHAACASAALGWSRGSVGSPPARRARVGEPRPPLPPPPSAAGLVAPGGVLVYSTCSIERVENQQQVAAFLRRHPEFAAEAPPAAAGVPPQCVSPEGFLAMLPHVHRTDGAFAARLRRAG